MTRVVLPAFRVDFQSDLSFDDVARRISERLFGGLPFVETDAFDEVPARRLIAPILGLWIYITHTENTNEFDIGTRFESSADLESLMRTVIDAGGYQGVIATTLNAYLKALLPEIEGVTVE